MKAFPIGSVELAFKRSRIKMPSLGGRSLFLVQLVNKVVGSCRVNFDAEYPYERLGPSELDKLCSIEAEFSETYQTGRPHDNTYLDLLGNHLATSHRFGLNLVLGNPKYVCTPRLGALEKKAALICMRYGCGGSRLKLGAEGIRYGEEIIRICSKLDASAYILYTPNMFKLLEASKKLSVNTAVYTPIRMAQNEARALSETVDLGGDYLMRRGIGKESAALRASDYILFGSPGDVVGKMREWLMLGVNKIVLSPLFSSHSDLCQQLHYIAKCISD